MPTASYVVIAIYIAFALVELARTHLFAKPEQTRDDAVVEVVSTIAVPVVIQPLILLTVDALMSHYAPQLRGALANLNVLAAILLFLVLDDMTQYWWHRASHSTHWLYNLHRAHHDGRYMSVRLVYRNNLFYYAMMPGIWLSGLLVYLGLGWVYAGYLIGKMAVIIGAHSDVAWDRPLYRIKALAPVMWLVERTISTPATHHAHHGRHADDPAVNYKGNYGNLLFFWDVLFGTAKITRTYPKSYGVENLAPSGFGQQLVWPLVPENKRLPDEAPAETAPASA
ncbi:sterol desaturase family protein [Novosphingobium sp.]|uniref:sterol desaturase family protein n=1 Tax=Novosphingobium sp. TaxID=1874826 RepID=UPI0035AFBB4C